jgi:MYXO-CTERM domain-containing protein
MARMMGARRAPLLPLLASIACIASFALVSLAPRSASAYCRATTCESGVRCEPATDSDCGVALSWRRACIGVSVHKRDSVAVSARDAQAAMLSAFAAWEGVSCGGVVPGIHVEDLGFVSCGQVEYNGKAGNANVLVFHDDAWPHVSGPHNIALTTVTFDTKTGEIFDADVEVNSASYTLTLGDTTSDYDLASVLTHEAGHFLGLAHSVSTDATMFAVYSPGTTDFRTLSADDASGICATYPPHGPETCNPIPRHGFSSLCGSEQVPSDCAFSPGNEGSRGSTSLALVGLVALARSARRRRATRTLTGRGA